MNLKKYSFTNKFFYKETLMLYNKAQQFVNITPHRVHVHISHQLAGSPEVLLIRNKSVCGMILIIFIAVSMLSFPALHRVLIMVLYYGLLT